MNYKGIKETDKKASFETTKNKAENLSGIKLDDVHVHYQSDKPRAIQAKAYTKGNDIYIYLQEMNNIYLMNYGMSYNRNDTVSLPTQNMMGNLLM